VCCGHARLVLPITKAAAKQTVARGSERARSF
jgi:hypothetical protein